MQGVNSETVCTGAPLFYKNKWTVCLLVRSASQVEKKDSNIKKTEEIVKALVVWSLMGQPHSIRWPHTHECTGSTNLTPCFVLFCFALLCFKDTKLKMGGCSGIHQRKLLPTILESQCSEVIILKFLTL